MPTYDYECQSCGITIEIVQSFHDTPKKKCPDCGKRALQRVLSGGVGIMFKGSGFYVNDSKSVSTANSKKSDSSSSNASSTNDASSTSNATNTSNTDTKKAATNTTEKPAKNVQQASN